MGLKAFFTLVHEQIGILLSSVQSRKVLLPTAASSVRGTCREAIIDTLLT
jgi:hypothetical protein